MFIERTTRKIGLAPGAKRERVRENIAGDIALRSSAGPIHTSYL